MNGHYDTLTLFYDDQNQQILIFFNHSGQAQGEEGEEG